MTCICIKEMKGCYLFFFSIYKFLSIYTEDGDLFLLIEEKASVWAMVKLTCPRSTSRDLLLAGK